MSKFVSIGLLAVAEMAGMSLWFTSAAILPDILQATPLSETRQALVSSAVQAGFVVGALVVSIGGLADRLDPRRLFAVCALVAAIMNTCLIAVEPGGDTAIAIRFMTGALLAGVYPVGMKIAVGWGTRDRGFLVALLVGALTVGKSAPYLAAFLGGADWRRAVVATSIFAAAGGALILVTGLGPHHARSPRFVPGAVLLAWSNPTIRRAYIGYLGHMWELYALWAWMAAAAAASYAATLGPTQSESLAKLTSFLAIGLGGLACLPAGMIADRVGKTRVAIAAMVVSGATALAAAASFGGPVWLMFGLMLVWGISVVPDSAQFSAIVSEASPPHLSGSLLTFQTALGFALTIFTVQVVPLLAGSIGWPLVLAGLAIGPAVGIAAMLPLRTRR